MVKRVQVVLTKDVSKLGRDGDLVDVAPGYARNYLIPQGIGVTATPQILRQVEKRREQERLRLLALKEEALTQQSAIAKLASITVQKQVGENEAIFGTVTEKEVAEAILAATQLDVDRRNITLPDINKLGTYTAQLKLHPEVIVNLDVVVTAQ